MTFFQSHSSNISLFHAHQSTLDNILKCVTWLVFLLRRNANVIVEMCWRSQSLFDTQSWVWRPLTPSVGHAWRPLTLIVCSLSSSQMDTTRDYISARFVHESTPTHPFALKVKLNKVEFVNNRSMWSFETGQVSAWERHWKLGFGLCWTKIKTTPSTVTIVPLEIYPWSNRYPGR